MSWFSARVCTGLTLYCSEASKAQLMCKRREATWCAHSRINKKIYRILDGLILILEIFNEKEDFRYQLFGVSTISQDMLDYWSE